LPNTIFRRRIGIINYLLTYVGKYVRKFFFKKQYVNYDAYNNYFSFNNNWGGGVFGCEEWEVGLGN